MVREAKDRVFLLDFSPFGEKYAESYAFNWNELENEFDVRVSRVYIFTCEPQLVLIIYNIHTDNRCI